jgi:pSer/pThr/pTyr-binding forkhead associated (FHA) protein
MAKVCPLAERGLGRGAMKAQFGLSHILCSTQSAAGFNGQPVGGWLVGLNGQHWGEDFRLCAGSLVIGTGYQSNICVTYPGLSTRHAEFVVQPGAFSLRDLGSREGTFVNGQQVSTAQILDGDEISFGQARFIFRNAAKFDPGYKPVLRPRPAVPVFRNESNKRLCAGWIVGQYGPYAGQDFRLLTGENLFGSASGLEISLVDAKLPPRGGYLGLASGGNCLMVHGGGVHPVRRVLQDSDEIQIGSHNFYVKLL